MADELESQKKIAIRQIRISLGVDLIEALEEMGVESDDLHNVVRHSLMYAVWAHSRGRGPYREMGTTSQYQGRGGLARWDEEIRARREAAELKRLFDL